MIRVVVTIVLLALYLYVIIDVVRTKKSDFKVLSKPWWIIVSFIPVLGAIAWFLWGMPRAVFSSTNRAKRNKNNSTNNRPAPEDDPEFLRLLKVKQKRQEREKKQKDSQTPQDKSPSQEKDNKNKDNQSTNSEEPDSNQ